MDEESDQRSSFRGLAQSRLMPVAVEHPSYTTKDKAPSRYGTYTPSGPANINGKHHYVGAKSTTKRIGIVREPFHASLYTAKSSIQYREELAPGLSLLYASIPLYEFDEGREFRDCIIIITFWIVERT